MLTTLVEPRHQRRRQPGRGRRGDRAAPALRGRPQQLQRGRLRASTCCGRRSSADCYGGILCTVDVAGRPDYHLRGAAAVRPSALDLLLPHANGDRPAPGAGYARLADQRLRALVHRAAAGDQDPPVQRAYPARPRPAGRGGGAGPAAEHADRGRHRTAPSSSSTRLARPIPAPPTRAWTSCRSFDDALDHPTTVARQIGVDALSAVPGVPGGGDCGGGLYPHRYRGGRASVIPPSTARTCSG